MATARATPGGFVWIGTVTRPHGVRGELNILEGEDSSGAWLQCPEVYIGETETQATCYQVRRARKGRRMVVLGLVDVASCEEAEKLRDRQVYVRRSELPETAEGTYYIHDLIGLQIVNRSGRLLGVLKDVFDNGAHELYLIRSGRQEWILPVIAGAVEAVLPDSGRIVVHPPEGLPGVPEG
jgi:16S rRNA processing protein RimM